MAWEGKRTLITIVSQGIETNLFSLTLWLTCMNRLNEREVSSKEFSISHCDICPTLIVTFRRFYPSRDTWKVLFQWTYAFFSAASSRMRNLRIDCSNTSESGEIIMIAGLAFRDWIREPFRIDKSGANAKADTTLVWQCPLPAICRAVRNTSRIASLTTLEPEFETKNRMVEIRHCRK